MLRSLWIKFFILLLGVSLIALSAALVLRELMIRDFREYAEGQLEDRVYWVIADLEGTYEKHREWKEDIVSEDAIWALMLGLDVRVLDSRGTVVMNTERALGGLPPLTRKRVTAIAHMRGAEKSEHYVPYPLFLAGKEIGSLEVQFLRPERENVFIERSNMFMLLSLLGMGGLVLVLSTIFSRRLARPIKRLAATAEAISDGDLKRRVPPSGKDEIGRLAISFNKMVRSLEAQESLRKRLISNVTHEIRTPLTAIKGEIAGMMDGLMPNDKEQLKSLYEEAGRLEGILEGIEELSRAQAASLFLNKKAEKLRPLLLNIQNTFEKLFLDKGVTFELQCKDELTANADAARLGQIIVNLVSNSLKATEKGGTVRIRAYRREKEICIEVEDTGHGIKQDDLPFIFERFYHSSEGGLGIGLAIVKELVDAHDGRIEVRSEFGRGSTFTVCLPAIES
ncbi:MAG: HAMP domain-containing sensor histidine kinase [Nitrospiraceae bacterium]|nr:HAMP domain-containing sensor histidine kinase [Nitrospiraceae bacterium]